MKKSPSPRATRFGPPKYPDKILINKNVFAEGEGLAERLLTLCIAPAGYGKTTLLAQWHLHLQAEGHHALWLSVTAADADPLSFLAMLEAGVREVVGAVDILDDPLSGAPADAGSAASYGRQLQRLQALLRTLEAPLVLFLDNYHDIDTADIAGIFDVLLQQAPPHCHFVISSRSEPGFRHTSLLLDGRAQVFDSDDLKLTPEESAEFIARHVQATQLSTEEVQLIYARTEGWPIAVQLCCLLANKHKSAHFLRDFSGRDIDLGHFLNEQVFRMLDPQLRQFAVGAALFDNFCAELCDAALQQSQSAQRIATLSRKKLFIYALDRNGEWFRFHQMFREFLLGMHERPSPKQASAILTAAAQWSLERGRYVDAIDYAVRAHNYVFAREMMIKSAQTIVRDEGLLPNLLQWTQKIPVEDSIESVDLRFWTSWSLAFSCRYQESEKEIRQLEKSLAESANLSRQQLARYRCNIGSLKVAIKIFQDKSLTVYHASEQWLGKYRRSADPFHVGVCAGARFLSARLQLEVLEARKAIDLAKSLISKANSLYGELWIAALDGLAQMEFGDYRGAEQTLLAGYKTSKSNSGGEISVIHSTIALLLARIAYEQDLIVQAQAYLREGYAHIMDHGLIETAAAGFEVRCYIAAEQDIDAAMAEVASAEFLIRHYPERLHFVIRQLRFNLLVNAGRVEQAESEAALMDISGDGFATEAGEEIHPLVFQQKQVLLVKLLLLQNRSDEARDLLQQLLAVASTAQRPRFHVELLVLDAYAQVQSGRVQSGCRAAMKAVAIALRNGLYRVFFESRHFFLPVARELSARRVTVTDNPEDQFLKRLLGDLNLRGSAPETGAHPSEPLTRRELELLRLLETGLSVQALADHLFVSKATVKWHLYNLYGKLRVRNRASALAWARNHLEPVKA